MSVPWLLSLGHVIVYSALFTKLWRVNRVLSFSRRKVTVKHVVVPMIVLFLAAIVLLVLWTVLDPLQWNRREINEETGESIGGCVSINIGIYMGPLLVVMIIPTFLTGFMAYKTKDVDEVYSESWWDIVLMLIQVLVIFISAPVMAVLGNESTNAQYLGFAFLLWSFPMSTLSLIFIPKARAYWKVKRGVGQKQPPKRGKHEGIRLSGVIQSAINQSVTHHSNEQSGRVETIEQLANNGTLEWHRHYKEDHSHHNHSSLKVVPEVQEFSSTEYFQCEINSEEVFPKDTCGVAGNDESQNDANRVMANDEEVSNLDPPMTQGCVSESSTALTRTTTLQKVVLAVN